jgi:hypothetical protein
MLTEHPHRPTYQQHHATPFALAQSNHTTDASTASQHRQSISAMTNHPTHLYTSAPTTVTATRPSLSATRAGTQIASVYSTNDPDNHILRCENPACRNKTYARWPDFKRHYIGAHTTHAPEFWCTVPGCDRGIGGRPFPRRDKLKDHVGAVHRGVE